MPVFLCCLPPYSNYAGKEKQCLWKNETMEAKGPEGHLILMVKFPSCKWDVIIFVQKGAMKIQVFKFCHFVVSRDIILLFSTEFGCEV